MDEDRVTIGNDRLRIEFNEPGVHPFVSLHTPGEDGLWLPAASLGARQVKYFHKGAAFPRLLCGDEEYDSTTRIEFAAFGDDGRSVSMTDTRSVFDIESSVALEGDGPIVHVVHRLTPTGDTGVNRVFDRYDFVAAPGTTPTEGLDYWYVPHLRPKPDMVIADHVFRQPVVMMRKGDIFFALIPDLELLEEAYESGPARYYLDFVLSGGENRSPAVCFGIGRTRTKGHVFFKGTFNKELSVREGEPLLLGYYLIMDRDGFDREDALSFLWERFGRRYLSSGLPQVTSFDRYASAGFARTFKRSDLFRRFELEGQQCGGTVAQHLVNRRGVRLMGLRELRGYLRLQDVELVLFRAGVQLLTGSAARGRIFEKVVYRYAPKVPPQILFQSWFNNLRSAYGAYWFARKWNDHELLENALAVKNLAILAPREEGAFPAVCYTTEEGIYWNRGTRAFKHIDWYHTADCSTTAYYMALWFADHEGDPRLLGRCREFAEFLLKVQLSSGAFPAWVRPSGARMEVSPALKESATAACPAMFLAMLYLLDGSERYLDAARRAADFLAEEVIPRQKWFDYETFYSCSSKRLGMFDAFTGSYPQNAMSMYWTAEALRLLHLGTGDPAYLDLGREVLDHLCLFQQVWDPPFLSINAFGGFASMNTDAEWNDARQALFVPVLMDYYRLTGNPDYMERGIAALRASFTTMYLDENRRVAPGNMRNVPGEEIGSTAENYGHLGYDDRTPGYLESDWGTGSACFAAAYAQGHYGDIFIDVRRMKAFGINGCRVRRTHRYGEKLMLEVEKHIDAALDVVIKASEAPPDLQVEVNGVKANKNASGDFSVLL